MESSRIAEILFGIPDRPIPREELIESIKKAIAEGTYITDERLAQAFDLMLEEIQSG
ncbi:MAG: flagellar biosynthesis anti-sigma factor FlgM [Planctomycetes bacterium]|nr:flagellar biosynthesis anti-sigma factor FlgM [Planctomycetota bacterium]